MDALVSIVTAASHDGSMMLREHSVKEAREAAMARIQRCRVPARTHRLAVTLSAQLRAHDTRPELSS
jgi:hypothetical protein